jgi:hypothetical protein
MDKNKFDAVFPIICSSLIQKIASEYTLEDTIAIQKLYEYLEREETKFWQYSTAKLFELWDEENKYGQFTFPQI